VLHRSGIDVVDALAEQFFCPFAGDAVVDPDPVAPLPGTSNPTAAQQNTPMSISGFPAGGQTRKANGTASAARRTVRWLASSGDRTPTVKNAGSSTTLSHCTTDPGTCPASMSSIWLRTALAGAAGSQPSQ
jgi:hypothetical protein